MSWKLHRGAQFEQHAESWDTLQRQTTNTPFLESAFVAPLLQVFGSGQELLAFHLNGGRLDAAALVRPTGGGRWETFQPSQLPLGAWIAGADEDVAALARELLLSLPGLALSLGLTQLDPRLNPRPAPRDSLRLQDYVNTSFIDIAGGFDTYWEQRGKNLRQNTRKQRNKLQTDSVNTRLDCVSSAAELPQALAHYGALESAGWKAGTGTAIAADNDQGRFYLQMLGRFCELGRARVYRYWFDDRVVAMDLCIDNGPLVVILKTAYDESFKQVSPSVLMRQDEFKAWWEEGRYRRIEFYGKTMEWHTRWTSDERGLYHATVFRWSWVMRLRDKLASRSRPPPEPGNTVLPLASPTAATP
jgi:CelD/BcsL family acetyltransferase involved in cellulose biosynthesis